jgi:ketosteroid isomerase-like protein
MSRNTDAVKAIYESFGKGDVPAILARLAPNVAWEHDWGGESLTWFKQRRGRDAVPGFFASLADFEFVRFEPFAFLEGDNMVAVPVRLELLFKANSKRILDLEMHLWTFGPDGLVNGFRHFVDTHQWAQATLPQAAPS